MAKLLVVPHRAVYGWAGVEDSRVERHPVTDLEQALKASYSTDAHLIPYWVELADGTVMDRVPRLNLKGMDALEAMGHRLLYGSVWLDCDDKEVAKGQPASQAWRDRFQAALEALPAELSDCGWYWTRGGARLLWLLPSPVVRAVYKALLADLRRQVADVMAQERIVVDRLTDETRLYRLPDVVRDGARSGYVAHLEELAPLERGVLMASAGKGPEGGSVFAGIEGVREPLTLPTLMEENRNITLARLGGALRNLGLAEREILATLTEVAALRAPQWVPDAGELERIAQSVGRYEAPPLQVAVAPPDSLEGVRWSLGSESEVADGTLEDLEVSEPVVFDRSKLWLYSPMRGVFEELRPDQIQAHVTTYDGTWIHTGGYNADGTPKVRPLKVGLSVTKGVLGLVQAKRAQPGWFDAAEDGLTLQNGFVTVERGRAALRPFSATQRSQAALPYPYAPKMAPDGFLAALRGCWAGDADCEDKIQLLREFVGACLLGMATRYQRGMVFLGSGANGKSTIQDIIGALFGDALVTAITPQDMGQEYRRAMLAGSRLNVVNELPEADILVSEAVKAIISGDAITARFIREQPFTYRPRCGNLFAANTLPGVRDMTPGFWRRWLVLEFNRSFTEREQDKGLAKRIIRTELGAIASWAIDGAAQLQARGRYAIPESSTRALEEWRSTADTVSRFVEERTVATEDFQLGAQALYEAFRGWAEQAGHKSMSRVKFGERLRLLGLEKHRKSTGWFYKLALQMPGTKGRV